MIRALIGWRIAVINHYECVHFHLIEVGSFVDVKNTTLKEILERRTQSELGNQWEHKHAVCDEIILFMNNGNQRVFSWSRS